MGKDKSKNTQGKPVTTDSRFSSVHSDPRFKLPKFDKVKVKVDERFSRKELDKLNAGLGGKKTPVDRYGRKLKQESKFDKYFKEESEEEESENESEEESEDEEKEQVSKKIKSNTGSKAKPKKQASPSESESEEESSDSEVDSDDDVNAELARLSVPDRARGEGMSSSESSESDDSDSSDSELEVESDIEIEDSKPEEGDPSDTFAVVNMDWDNIRAVDLMATFISFVPKSGLIKSVTIYPSEFGKQQMQKEEIEGPPKELFKKKKRQQDSDSDSEDEIDTKSAAGLERAAKKLYQEDNGEEDYDGKALRRYQLQRLRYYYAVVKCDSVSTAKNIYDSCDGTEYESTANIFDLRYVPEGMDFEDSEAKDVCTKIPKNYKPSMFVTDALQHSKVKLTWDETPKERLAISSRLFSQREIEDMDFKAYLASDSEEEEEKVSAKDKYKQLLGGSIFDRKEDDDVDMEISFNPGLEDQKQEEEKDEDQIDSLTAYKLKQKERRKARMERFKEKQKEEVPEDSKDNKSKSNKKDKKNGKHATSVDEKAQAELELLMMDDESKDNHFSMKDIIKSEKKKNKKKKSQDLDTQDNFEVDLDDDRFKEIFEDRSYNIDPSNTDFKKTKTMKKILEERSKRQSKNDGRKTKRAKVEKSSKAPETSDVNSLVAKLKRKHNKK